MISWKCLAGSELAERCLSLSLDKQMSICTRKPGYVLIFARETICHCKAICRKWLKNNFLPQDFDAVCLVGILPAGHLYYCFTYLYFTVRLSCRSRKSVCTTQFLQFWAVRCIKGFTMSYGREMSCNWEAYITV